MKYKHLIIILICFIVLGGLSLTNTVFADTRISGNVKENLGGSELDIPIKGIRVTIKEQNTGEQHETATDEDGNYCFLGVSPGNYDLQFMYGDLKVIRDYPSLNLSNQDILKYNGQDYIASNMNGVTVELAEQVIPQIGKTAAQVFFVVDTSGSMRNSVHGFRRRGGLRITAEDPTSPTRLENVQSASKTLVEKIFEQDENIYMGLIQFSSSPHMLSHMCRDTEGLQGLIDGLNADGSTMVSEALNMARRSFVANEGAKIIILLTDGEPTEPDSRVINEIKQIRSEGIELFTLVVTDDVNEAEIRRIFKESSTGSTKLVLKESGDELAECIEEYIPTWIKQKVDEIRDALENVTNLPTIECTPERGIEDEARRNRVDSYFAEKFHYHGSFDEHDIAGETYLFDALKDRNNLTNAEIRKLGRHTYMTVTYNNIVVYENTRITKLNLKLKRREPFLMNISVKAVGLRITLSDGTVLFKDINTDEDHHIFYTSLDEDLAHGSLVEVEYEVTINNNSSSIACTNLELLAYLPEDLCFDSSQKLITSPRTTKTKNGWTSVDINELHDFGYVSDELIGDEDLTSRNIAMFSGDYEFGFYILPHSSYTTRFVASIVISDANQMTFNTINYVEVLGYKNNKYRRMEAIQTDYEPAIMLGASSSGSTASTFSTLFPGDGERNNIDFAGDTNTELIVPPTGSSKRFNSIFSKLINFLSIIK